MNSFPASFLKKKNYQPLPGFLSILTKPFTEYFVARISEHACIINIVQMM